jgi:hypothetical protein
MCAAQTTRALLHCTGRSLATRAWPPRPPPRQCRAQATTHALERQPQGVPGRGTAKMRDGRRLRLEPAVPTRLSGPRRDPRRSHACRKTGQPCGRPGCGAMWQDGPPIWPAGRGVGGLRRRLAGGLALRSQVPQRTHVPQGERLPPVRHGVPRSRGPCFRPPQGGTPYQTALGPPGLRTGSRWSGAATRGPQAGPSGIRPVT